MCVHLAMSLFSGWHDLQTRDFFKLVPRAFLRQGEGGREKTLASADHVISKHPEKLGVIIDYKTFEQATGTMILLVYVGSMVI